MGANGLASVLNTPGPQHRPDEAERLLWEVAAAADSGLKLDPQSKAYRYARACALWELGIFYRETNRADKGLPLIRQALAAYQSLDEQFPWDQDIWKTTRSATGSLDATLRSAQLTDDLKQAVRQQYDWLQRVSPAVPNDPVAQRELLRTQISVVNSLHSTGQSAEADELVRTAREQLRNVEPHALDRADDSIALAQIRLLLPAEAWTEPEAAKTEEELNQAIKLAPEDATVLNNVAWTLATCRPAEIRDGKRAVALATRACELTRL